MMMMMIMAMVVVVVMMMPWSREEEGDAGPLRKQCQWAGQESVND